MTHLTTTDLRSRFAEQLSKLYGQEVPAYRKLVEVSSQVNHDVLLRDGTDAERLGSLDRVTAERHGAVRVGTPRELRQLSRIFLAMGMHPVGFYDLRDARPRPVPVVATAFRPIDRRELELNPFRMFTSMLVPEDRRFFDADLESRLKGFLGRRELFTERLLYLAERAIADNALPHTEADEFLYLALLSFALSTEPVDRAWYSELEKVSSVAADIGGSSSTHINHLTPRVLDIDELYKRMTGIGIEMIDAIQGPPASAGPDVLLRQTSFKALAEARTFLESDGQVQEGSLRVRFGEVEARGIALTAAGRDVYDRTIKKVDELHDAHPETSRAGLLADAWGHDFPSTEAELWRADMAFFRYSAPVPIEEGLRHSATLPQLVDSGWIELTPIVYEDFLPRSAAGIFSSNLTGTDNGTFEAVGAPRDMGWLSDVLENEVNVPEDLYAAESAESIANLREA